MTSTVEALLDAYFAALEAGTPLEAFYATDAEAGELGPVVKIGSGRGEVYVGRAQVAEAVRSVGESLTENRLERRARRVVRVAGDVAFFADVAWWSGMDQGKRFGSLTRWTGVCLRVQGGWKLLHLHVSEEAE
ncbi:MAG TPA: nuclear transport factor 2 family protein [Chloroflexota bacterium]|nr:nuclear transport factor 2 family protein [Chloroflexota bacterium]